MNVLPKNIHTILENTIRNAREVAEAAVRAELVRLGVEKPKPDSFLNEKERNLRLRLRKHARTIGDEYDSRTECQKISRLIEEGAYELWHRMLFARFLAENNLLMYSESEDEEPISISLEECHELAKEMGETDGWDLAARCAVKMLPNIFRDSLIFRLELPREKLHALEQFVASLPKEVFEASDALGWTYQFWQEKRKKEINESEVKIGANELPSVTQLFTEPYMVAFLLDNSIGAWLAKKRLTPDDWLQAESEEELRTKTALPGIPFEYLRFVRTETSWEPAAGWLDDWPENLQELKVLDPC